MGSCGPSPRNIFTTPKKLFLRADFARMAIEVFIKPLEARQADTARKSMIAYVYEAIIFNWIVDYINDYIAVQNADFTIGVLDIFGFENFVLNSFPQV